MDFKKILVVDDEFHIQELIKYNLELSGFIVETADSGEMAIRKIKDELPDLIILDLMLPGIDGLEVCKRLKSDKTTKAIPIIMLTAKTEEFDKVLGLELGADDYMTKPFSVRELTARAKALFRRISPEEDGDKNVINVGNIIIDDNKREVYVNDNLVELPMKEYEILKMLSKNKGNVVSRDEILEYIWGYKYYGETRTVDVHIRHLRKKIEIEGSLQFIETVRGIGYKLIVKGE